MALDNEQIVKYLETLDKETKAIKHEALKFSWWMRGGVSYEDAMYLSTAERDMIGSIIKENIETTKDSGLPFF